MSPEDAWFCGHCKDHVEATKKFDLWRLPQQLVIHLKRFSYKKKYWREKLETFVDYPIHDLDLSPYINSPQDSAPIYDLYAVSNHFGSLGGGHYTAYAKNFKDNKWYKYDDSSVQKVDESKVKTSAAYVLFYRRKDTISPPAAVPTSSKEEEEEMKVDSNGTTQINTTVVEETNQSVGERVDSMDTADLN